MKTILIALLLCAPAFGQEWIDTDQTVPQDWVSDLQTQQVELSKLLEEFRSVVDEAKAAAADARVAASEARSLKATNMTSIDDEIRKLQERPAFTEEQIRGFAADEFKKITATVTLPDGTTKSIEAKNVTPVMEKQVVAGYAGTFDVPVGGYISSIDGQPVTRQSIPATGVAARVVGNVMNGAYTNAYNVHASRQASGPVRFFAAPRQGTCSMVNGVKVCN